MRTVSVEPVAVFESEPIKPFDNGNVHGIQYGEEAEVEDLARCHLA